MNTKRVAQARRDKGRVQIRPNKMRRVQLEAAIKARQDRSHGMSVGRNLLKMADYLGPSTPDINS